MTTANEAYRGAKSFSEEVGDSVSDFARDVSKKAKKGASRAESFARDAYEEAHDTSKDYPHLTIAIAAGLGFLLGMAAANRG